VPAYTVRRVRFAGALAEFIDALRQASVAVSMVEALDAVAALEHIELLDRAQFRAALRATLVKRVQHEAAFDSLFDVYFTLRRAAPEVQPDGAAEPKPEADAEQPLELADALLDALASGDAAAMRALAQLAVDRYGGIQAQRAGSPQMYYVYRTLRQLDLSNLLQRSIRAERARALSNGADSASPFDAVDDRALRQQMAQRLEELRRLVEQAVRERLLHVGGQRELVASARSVPIEDVDFLDASPTQLKAMRQAIQPLARQLAARIARRRQALRRRGRLDVRRTMRRALSTGGVPLDPVLHRPRVSRPELALVCDVSGSVAEFAEFTMALLHAMSEEFPRLRSFAFVDGVDEVTRLIDQSHGVLDSYHLLAGTHVVANDGHSDYGTVLERFRTTFGLSALTAKTTVIITGDARNNYRPDAAPEALRAIRARARAVYWLNPEPRADWDTTDSIMSTYAAHCDSVHEVRNLRQLEAFVNALL
jgi:uncharacterized protein with von Willebrand factor type A (vWA) domain